MELRTVRIFAFGVLGLVIALSFSFVEIYLLGAMALTPLLLLIVGQFYLPRSNRAIQLQFKPGAGDDEREFEDGEPLARLSGQVISYSQFKKAYEFQIVQTRFWLLGAIGLFSFASLWFLSLPWDLVAKGFAYWYLFGSLWIVVMFLALRWGWERRVLRFEGLSLAAFSVSSNPRPPYRQIRYSFVDNNGEYRGAIFDSMVCNASDSMTVVFYSEANPDQSVPASAMIFHKLVWKDSSN